jgi:methyl-accepting chemotaxis protein
MSLLTRLKLSRKLAVIFAVLSIIAGVTLGVIYIHINNMDEADEALVRGYQVVIGIERSATAMSNAQSSMRAYLLTGDAQFPDLYKRWKGDFATSTGEATGLIRSPEQQRRMQDIVGAATAWQALAEKVLVPMDVAARQDAQQLVTSGQDKAVMDKFRAAVQQFRDAQNQLQQDRVNAGDVSADTARYSAIGGGALVVFLSVIAGLLLYFDIGVPLVAMTAAMRRLAGGDISIEVPGAGRSDELGDMAAAVGVFRDNAAERRRLERSAQVELDREAHRQANIEKLIETFRGMISQVLQTFRHETDEMKGAAGTLTSAADTANQEADAAKAASANASANVQTVAAAAEQLSASIREIAGQAHKTLQGSGECQRYRRPD